MKPAIFHPKVREIIRAFPEEVKDDFGQSLLLVQYGHHLGMPKSRPMPSVAAGAEEMRLKGRDGIYRVFYFTRSARGILVFHAFMKKSQKTPCFEIEISQKRLRELLYEEKN